MSMPTYDAMTDRVVYQNVGIDTANIESQGEYLRLAMALLDQAGISESKQKKVMVLLDLEPCDACGIVGGIDLIDIYPNEPGAVGTPLCRDCGATRRAAG